MAINFPTVTTLNQEYLDIATGITYTWVGTVTPLSGYWKAKVILTPPSAIIPVGAILPMSGNVVPTGFLRTNGALVNRVGIYADLFDYCVTQHGFTPQTFTVALVSGLFTKNAHGFKGGERVRLFTTGSLLTGLLTSIDYYVIYGSANTFYLTATRGGSKIIPTGTQSGTHTFLQSLYGLGDGVNTFNLPLIDDEFLRAAGSIANVGAWQEDMFESHDHGLPSTIRINAAYSGFNANGLVNSNSGSAINVLANGGFETRPRSIALNYCIKY